MTPSAVGNLADTPLAHALIHARNRKLTGQFALAAPDDRRATLSLWQGRLIAVETIPAGMCPGGFFGAIVYELGIIDSSALDETLLEIAQTKQLHGEVLVQRKAITTAQRDEVLVEQVHRKVHHLFTFPDSTTFAFYDATRTGTDPSIAVDPLGPVWRGVRDYPPTRYVDETIRRVGDSTLRATGGGSARLPPAETALVHALAVRPMTLAEMKTATDLPASRVELLVYLLVIAKCIESVSIVRVSPSIGVPPVDGANRMRDLSSGPRTTTDAPRISGMMPSTSRPSHVPTPLRSSKVPPQQTTSSKFPAVTAPGSRPVPGTLAALRTPAELGRDGILARAASIQNESYFEVLGVADGASTEAIRAAFMRLAKTWHPDRLAADFSSVRGEVATIFAHMTRAQKTLCDDESRRAYVAERKAKNAARPRHEIMRELELALAKQDFDLVVRHCQSLIDENPDDAEAIATQAWAAVRNGDATDDELRLALTKLDRATNVDRTCDQAVYLRGMAHKRLGNATAALRDFGRAVQINPKHIEAAREVRIFAMRARKGSGEHKLVSPTLDKKTGKK